MRLLAIFSLRSPLASGWKLWFIRRQQLKALLRRQLNIHAHAVRKQAEAFQQSTVRAGNGLRVDIAGKMVFLPKHPQRLNHPLAGIIRVLQNTGTQKQPLNIITAVKIDGEVRKLPGVKEAQGTSLERRLMQY